LNPSTSTISLTSTKRKSMSPFSYYLITLLSEATLIRVALKTDVDVEFYMEPEGIAQLLALLPPHVRSIGPIVDVEEIFDVVDATVK